MEQIARGMRDLVSRDLPITTSPTLTTDAIKLFEPSRRYERFVYSVATEALHGTLPSFGRGITMPEGLVLRRVTFAILSAQVLFGFAYASPQREML